MKLVSQREIVLEPATEFWPHVHKVLGHTIQYGPLPRPEFTSIWHEKGDVVFGPPECRWRIIYSDYDGCVDLLYEPFQGSTFEPICTIDGILTKGGVLLSGKADIFGFLLT